jgi:hypothetical protein
MARKKAVRVASEDSVERLPPLCPPMEGVGFLPYQRGEHGGPHSHWIVVRQSQAHGMQAAGPFHSRAAAAEYLYDEWREGKGDTAWIEYLRVPRQHIEDDDC